MSGKLPTPRRQLVVTAEVLWWWLAACGVWLLTLSSVNAAELVVSLACALPCGLAAWGARVALGEHWRPRPGWVWWLGPLAVSALTDAVRVLLLAVRHHDADRDAGRLVDVLLPDGEAGDVASGRAAVATLVMSTTPATLVVQGDPERGVLTLHSLVPSGSMLERAVRR
jgi:multisubunit Na+/H+ antiporter MnhE subunit